MKLRLMSSIAVLVALLAITGSASASQSYAAIGYAFTYQGQLTDSGSPANGAYDFTFSLYDDPSTGSQVGSSVPKNDITVTNGLFTVDLDFGDVFDGTPLYLEIGVRPGSETGAYTTLSPRQSLTATPYARYSVLAWNANNANTLGGLSAGHSAGNVPYSDGMINTNLNADLLDGFDGSAFQNASNITWGTLGNSYFSAYSDLSAEGYLGNAVGDLALNNGSLNTNLNADMLDGYHASGLGTSHNHWGQTWTGSGTGLTLSGGTNGLNASGSLMGVIANGTTYGVQSTGGDTGVYATGPSMGVYGVSSTGTGVQGSGGPDGVHGFGSVHGVNGTSYSTNGIGVYGYSSSGAGVSGSSGSSTGVLGVGNPGVRGESVMSGQAAIYGYAIGGSGPYAGYFQGDVRVTGNFAVDGLKSASVETADYGKRLMYAVESPENWFEDFGSGQLVDGKAVVPIEPIYAETVNLADGYHVFLTPLGDCALFVAEKTATSFTVEPIGGAACSAAFDYRIVGKRLGAEDVRLGEAYTASPASSDVASGQ